MNQQEHDLRSLDLHRLVCMKLQNNQQLLTKAHEIVLRWRQEKTDADLYLEQWQTLIEQGFEACVEFSVGESEWHNAMRQNSPLSCLLTPIERWKFFKDWRKDHETA